MTTAAFDRLLALVQAEGERGVAQALAELAEALAASEAAKSAAEAANEAKTRFLASLAHEIRSPLNAIYGYAQLLERNDGKDALRAARVIRRSSEHLAHLVEGLLDISHIESGSLTLSRDMIRFPAFLSQLIDMLEPQAGAKGIALVLDHPPGLPEFVRGDEKRLRQVLINLVSNAIKFTDAGQVTLKVQYRNELAHFTVIDTGIGIAPDDLARIFTPFERGSGAAAERPGIGLGLAITQALVRIMGGDITAESVTGKGARFTVKLMLSQPLTQPVEPAVPGAVIGYDGPKRTLVVIDDDAAHLAMLRALLEPLGFAVHTAGTGPAGITLATQVEPDLVLLDVSLPGLSGWEVAAQLREKHGPRLRIVMLTGETPQASGWSDGGPANDQFVKKPFAFGPLLDLLGAQLGLTWKRAAAKGARADPAPPPCLSMHDDRALPHFAAIEQLVRIGHVRGIEAEIDAIAALAPEAAPLAERLRAMLDSFDLKGLSNLARAGQGHEH
jgi:nitrogen-specific signal transduction histidine kinase/CheY-like chemotaxis protein